MKISKKDALLWFSFFAQLPDDEDVMPRQLELVYATLSQIETAVEARRAKLLSEIPGLQSLQGRTLFVGDAEKFSQGCRSCLLGNGLSAIRKTNKCNAKCPFCYDYGQLHCQPPIGEGMWEIGGTKYRVEDLDLLFAIHGKPTGVSYVYLEPFMEIEEYGDVIRRFHQEGVHQHMYTNGTLCTEDNLKMLSDAGLDELRFNLGASNTSDKVIASMALARKYFRYVGVETPMTPDFYEQFQQKKQQIFDTGVDFMNCAELHLNANNIGNYEGEPMYMTRLGYLSPIWSRDLTLRLMKQAAEEKWPLLIHDCSNRTKFARDMNLKAKEGGWFGSSSYACEFTRLPYAAFLPTLEDDTLPFVQEEPLPKGFRPGDIVL